MFMQDIMKDLIEIVLLNKFQIYLPISYIYAVLHLFLYGILIKYE